MGAILPEFFGFFLPCATISCFLEIISGEEEGFRLEATVKTDTFARSPLLGDLWIICRVSLICSGFEIVGCAEDSRMGVGSNGDEGEGEGEGV